jgi:phospholipid transport system substrate-binding protein
MPLTTPPLARRTLLAALACTLATPALAQDIAADSRAFVQTLVDEALRELTDKALTEAERERRFGRLFSSAFDVPAIGRFVLGASNWRQASEAQRREYLELFETMVIRTYSQRFTEYSGEPVRVTGARAEDATLALVQSAVITASGPARVDWRVLRNERGLRVVDLIVEGASLANSQREEFTSVIQRGGGGLEPLLVMLRQRVQRAS